MTVSEVLRLKPPVIAAQYRHAYKKTKIEDITIPAGAGKDHHVAFFPFGRGPKTYNGQHFAMLAAKTAMDSSTTTRSPC
ncbi:hypothetical protein G4B88_030650 [Cannabis sativa]|uniref:Uncharacterized protein n=1 Tax=Cannabis sativa TaxID=3483 RepID=A0A7J6H6Q7_CANSA|nr:hypothetical protein G4B88_030650 [Cannabis sativa]